MEQRYPESELSLAEPRGSLVDSFTQIASSLPIGVAVKSVEDGFVYRYWNPRMERLYGYPAAEAVGYSDEALFSEEVALRSRREDTETVRRAGRPLYGRAEPTGPPAHRHVQRTKILIRDGGESYLASFVTDVTELHESQRAAQETRDWKDLMLAVISHDVLATLKAVTDGLGELEESWEVVDRETGKKTLSLLKGGASRSADLLQDLLLWSKSSSGREGLDAETIELPALLSQVARRVQIATGRSVTVDTPASLPLLTSSRAIETILRNLITNACEHTSSGGVHLTIATTGPEGVELRVRDEGGGFPESFIEPLNRGVLPDSLDPGRTGRRGIGLKICQSMAERVGATLVFENPSDGGGQVRLILNG